MFCMRKTEFCVVTESVITFTGFQNVESTNVMDAMRQLIEPMNERFIQYCTKP